MNRYAVLVVCVVIAGGLTGWAFWERSEKIRLTDEVADLRFLLAKSASEYEKAVASAPAVKSGKSSETEVAGKVTMAEAGATKPGEEGKSMADGLVKMMENPQMRDAMKAQARMGIDAMNRDLFDLLDLQEPKRSQLEKLVNEKTAMGMDVGFSMLGTKKTPEEMKKVSEDLLAKNKEYDERIKALLGDEDYSKLKRYEDSTGERMQLKTFTGMLSSRNLELDEATETRLMDAMYNERQKFPFASNFASQQNADMSRFSAENITRFGDEYSRLSDNIVNRAGSILTEAQLEVFRDSQAQTQTMVKMHIEMAGKMFGTGGDQTQDP